MAKTKILDLERLFTSLLSLESGTCSRMVTSQSSTAAATPCCGCSRARDLTGTGARKSASCSRPSDCC
jgi:hypothetical protein